ncbi:flavin reductase family protein [Rhodoferax sp.]|uniref:flavin reductase family protein n=1 Tax=Rhodoferax sp. TaxID=50421 RepID=UPI0026117C6D|nr:flavin reductase family protein [Rhodoferax sp.]MDD2924652.1 flavin reductase family protein [Rhodoferax sp.]
MNTNNPLIEAGHPLDDVRAFRRCLGQFATGVTVMTTQHDGQKAGMSVNSFAALSLEPALVLWSIRRESGSWPLFRAAGHFAVNVLAEDQVELASQFAKPGEEKFGLVPWAVGQAGSPLLSGTIAHMECSLEQIHEGGDHFIVVGRVLRYARFGGEPLLFTQGRYAVTQEHPGAVQSTTTTVSASASAVDAAEGSLMRLLHYSSHQMSAWFDEHREAEHLSVAQFRIYGWLRTMPRTLDQIKQLAYLGGRDADDAIADLLDRGHITCDEAGVLSLTPIGRERADASARRVTAFETERFQGISQAEIATTRRVLGLLAHRVAAS